MGRTSGKHNAAHQARDNERLLVVRHRARSQSFERAPRRDLKQLPAGRQEQTTTRVQPPPHRHRRRADLEAHRDWAIITVTNHSLLVLIAAITAPAPVRVVLALLLGAGLAIGAITVLHDAGHSRFGRHYLPNMLAAQSAVPIGLWVAQWTLKHQVHHRLPANYPDDEFTTAGGFLRIHPAAPMRAIYRFQHLYAWLLYCLLWPGDLLSQARFLIHGHLPGSDCAMAAKRRFATFLFEKLTVGLFLLPYFLVAGPRLLPILALAAVFGGLLVSSVLIVGHVNTSLNYTNQETGSQSWASHVVATTASFSTHSRVMNWLTGGLTHHLGHHLRPSASRQELHQLYPRIKNDLERQLGLTVMEFPTLRAAIKGHWHILRQLGGASPNSLSVPTRPNR
jgi:linoleoyl-CoA desaturase